MSNIGTSDWSTSAASNSAAPPNGWPEGQSPSSVNDCAREGMAAVKKWFLDTNGSLVTTGTGTAYLLTTNSGHAALSDLSLLVCEIHTDSTGACTLAVDGLTAKSIKMPGGADPAAGTLKAGSIAILAREASADVYVLVGGANGAIISADLRLMGVISPTQIGADANDYAPTDLATASTLRLSSDASRSITGLTGGGGGRILVLHNVGANDIVLADESVLSTAANRFALTGAITLEADDAAVLQYDSASSRWRALAWPFKESAAPAAPTIQTFTSSGTWTKPTGCRAARVRLVGGGGGGAGSGATGNRCGAGGAAGGYAEKLIDVTAISSATITIGAAGGAGTTGGIGGAAGSTSWSDGTNTITGNGGGEAAVGTASTVTARSTGGTATGGDINIPGQNGGAGGAADVAISSFGNGGSSPLGLGGQSGNALAGEAAKGYGAGGSGGSGAGTPMAGGAGTAGILIVTEYY